eukprot:5096383-Amphidinium_carterae.2
MYQTIRSPLISLLLSFFSGSNIRKWGAREGWSPERLNEATEENPCDGSEQSSETCSNAHMCYITNR